MPPNMVMLSKEDSEKLEELLRKLYDAANTHCPAMFASDKYTLWCDRVDHGFRFGGRYYPKGQKP